MRRSFTITVPAADLSLLTIEQLRSAAGVPDGDTTQDARLEQLGLAISLDIAKACKINGDGVNPITLLSETMVETFWNNCPEVDLILSRRFVSDIDALTEAGTALVADTDYWLDGEAGMLYRQLSDGRSWSWYSSRAYSVTYTAGLTEIPADLVEIAMDLVRFRTAVSAVNPLEKSTEIEIPGVRTIRTDRWVGDVPGSANGPVPDAIQARLGYYAMEPLIGVV